MRYLKQFGLFCWDFVVGDDWRLAGSAIASVGITLLLAHHGMNVWWMLPILIVAAVALSVGMVARSARTQASKDPVAQGCHSPTGPELSPDDAAPS
jgi:hypothetical protein